MAKASCLVWKRFVELMRAILDASWSQLASSRWAPCAQIVKNCAREQFQRSLLNDVATNQYSWRRLRAAQKRGKDILIGFASVFRASWGDGATLEPSWSHLVASSGILVSQWLRIHSRTTCKDQF